MNRETSRSPRRRSPGRPNARATKREISSSRERSRERERQRRKRQAECIRRAGGFQKLADSEGREPVRLFWDGFQWVAKTSTYTALQTDPALMNSTRKLRRLYVGNLPLHLGLTESLFQDMLWLEMKQRGLCNNPDEQPVLCVWFAKDKGNYGFIEFASVDETNRALQHLDGMLCMGVALKISRPNDYVGAAGAAQATALPVATPAVIPAVTPVVYFQKMVLDSDLEEEDTWQTMLDDVCQGCAGPPDNPRKIVSAALIDPERSERCPYGVGDVFIEFGTAEEAVKCIQQMTGRKYLERPVAPVPLEFSAYTQLVRPLYSDGAGPAVHPPPGAQTVAPVVSMPAASAAAQAGAAALAAHTAQTF